MKLIFTIFVLCNLILVFPKAKSNSPLWKEKITADREEYQRVCDFIKTKTDINSIIVSRKPQMLYYYAQRKSFCYPFTDRPDSMVKILQTADYVLADNVSWTSNRYLNPTVVDSIKHFNLIARGNYYYLFVVKKLTN